MYKSAIALLVGIAVTGAKHALPNPHAIPTNASYWESQLDRFLKSLRAP